MEYEGNGIFGWYWVGVVLLSSITLSCSYIGYEGGVRILWLCVRHSFGLRAGWEMKARY